MVHTCQQRFALISGCCQALLLWPKMDCGSTCEQTHWLGAQGICNITTGLCECAEVYHGFDDWKSYNDCHINISLQKTIWAISIAASAITFIAALFSSAYLLVYWWKIPQKTANKISRKRSFTSSANISFSSNDNETSIEKKHRKLKKRAKHWRQFYITSSMYLYCSFTLMAMLYYVSFFFDNYRFQGNWFQDVTLALCVPSVYAGLWIYFYIWYLGLPNLKMYGRLFKVESIFIRHPNFIKKSVYARIILLNIVGFSLLFIVPTIWPETRDMCDRWFLILAFAELIDMFVCFFFVLLILRKLFRCLEDLNVNALANKQAGGVDKNVFARAIATINIMICAVTVVQPIAATMIALCAFWEPAKTRVFLFVNIAASCGMFASCLCIFIIMRHMKGVKSNRSPNSALSNEIDTMNSSDEYSKDRSSVDPGR